MTLIPNQNAHKHALETPDFQVRGLKDKDLTQALELMRELAEFEDYLDRFKVTTDDLSARGLSADPQFFAFVAVTPSRSNPQEETVVGLAVCYPIKYTVDLSPTIILKELYIRDDFRGLGIGKALFGKIVDFVKSQKASRLQWLVLKGNHRARDFYQSLGASEDQKWENWQLDVPV